MRLLTDPLRPRLLNPLNQAPLWRPALALMAGIAAGRWADGEISPVIGLAAMGMLLLLALLLHAKVGKGKEASRHFALMVYLAVTAAGATLCTMALKRTTVTWPDTEAVYVGEVTTVDKFTARGISINLRLLPMPRGDGDGDGVGHTVRLHLTGRSAQNLRPGDRLTFTARLTDGHRAGNPGSFDYRAYLQTQGISGTGYVDSTAWRQLAPAPQPDLRTRLLQLRQRLSKTYATHFSDETLAILSALTLGDKTLLTPEIRATFSDTGTSHILALSGLHLSILFTLLQWAYLRWIRRRWLNLLANGLTLLALWTFVLLTGAPISLVRAATMFTLLQTGVCLQRSESASLNNLALAALLILAVSPLALYDVGFQLSFSAVAGILLIGRYVWQRYPLPPTLYELAPLYLRPSRRLRLIDRFTYQPVRKIVWPFITVSLGAQIATAPLIIYYFHSLPPYALLANVVVIPTAYVLLGGSLLFFLIPWEPARACCANVLAYATNLMTKALERIASWPGASIALYPTALTLVALTVCCIFLYLYLVVWNRRPRLLMLAAIVALLGLSGVSEAWRLRPDRIAPGLIIYSLPRTTAVQFIRSADDSRLYTSTTADSARLRLDYVEKNFFAPHHMAFPRVLTAPRSDEGWLMREGDFYQCLGQKLFILRRDLGQAISAKPVSLDVLLVTGSCRDWPDSVLRTFRPVWIVLDRTLPYFRRQRWLEGAQRHGLPCHDLATQGAFIRPVRRGAER